MLNNICGEKHAGIQACSKDRIHWEAYWSTKAYSRRIQWDGGTEQVMGSLERPFILFQDNKPTHLFFATADGPGGFSSATETWNMVIPLKINNKHNRAMIYLYSTLSNGSFHVLLDGRTKQSGYVSLY